MQTFDKIYLTVYELCTPLDTSIKKPLNFLLIIIKKQMIRINQQMTEAN
jgi:hypothetical protein